MHVLGPPQILVIVQPVFVDEHADSLRDAEALQLRVLQAPFELQAANNVNVVLDRSTMQDIASVLNETDELTCLL